MRGGAKAGFFETKRLDGGRLYGLEYTIIEKVGLGEKKSLRHC